jgi:hypothetical protein
MAISRVEEICPNAIPKAPSIICAAKPIKMKGRRRAGSAMNSVGMPNLHPVAGD